MSKAGYVDPTTGKPVNESDKKTTTKKTSRSLPRREYYDPTTGKPIGPPKTPKAARDLTRDISRLEQDVQRVGDKVRLTSQQSSNIKQVTDQLESLKNQIRSGGLDNMALLKIQNDIANIERIKQEVETPKRRSAFTKPGLTFPEIIQELYVKSNYPSQAEMQKALEEHGISGARVKFRHKTICEALTRMAYVATELIGGGVREATLGLSGS